MPRVKELKRDGLAYRIKFRSPWATVLTFGHDIVTLGRTIHCRHRFITERAHAHEFGHLLQYRKYGIHGFVLRYITGWLTHGYHGHPLEREAHEYADRYVGAFSLIRESDE